MFSLATFEAKLVSLDEIFKSVFGVCFDLSSLDLGNEHTLFFNALVLRSGNITVFLWDRSI
jgi:hypothetical protein